MRLTIHMVNNLGYFVLTFFFLSRTGVFNRIMKKENYTKRDQLILSMFFSAIAIIGTYIGEDYHGAITNTRNIGVVLGGLLGGPLVGIVAGFAAGIHRILIDIGGITSVPCGIATALGGILSGVLYKRVQVEQRYLYGLFCGVIVENMSMGFILLMSKPFDLALDIVKNIYLPMVGVNGIGIAIIILITDMVIKEKEKSAGEQARVALEIANKTLPYFRKITKDSLLEVCRIILESVGAQSVVITDNEKILASFSEKDEYAVKHRKILSQCTQKVLDTGKALVLGKNEENDFKCVNPKLSQGIIAPLKEGKEVTGTIKIYFAKDKRLGDRETYLALGISQLISTQLEISKIENLKEMADKAEIKALQTQINPHFLFNALNTITSFIRMDPDIARELIINLANYMRYNLEIGDEFVTIEKELEQVRAYVNIEKARFGDRLFVSYDVEEEAKMIKIPSLIIQPLVENSVKHGILPRKEGGAIDISIKALGDYLEIEIRDNGVGIDETVIQKIYEESIDKSKIGLINVHNRLKLIFGKGLEITRLEQGTLIKFRVPKEGEG